jgi:hypothetical protein
MGDSSEKVGGVAAAAPGISSVGSLPIVLERPETGVQQRREGGGTSEGKRAAAMETSDRLAAYCGDEAMTHVVVSQHLASHSTPSLARIVGQGFSGGAF